MKNSTPLSDLIKFILIVFLILSVPLESRTQNKARPYLNAGYITNFSKCSECKKADTGGSIRVGVLTKKRVGFYVGYLWFNEYHLDFIEYDDKGSGFVAGVDIRILRKGNFEWYGKLGLFNEKFTSTYPNRSESETETSIKPDFGVLFNISHINVLLGWQPSDPPHVNIGVGVTL